MPRTNNTDAEWGRALIDLIKGVRVETRVLTGASGEATVAPGPNQRAANPMTAEGQMIYGGDSGVELAMAAGTEGQVPTVQADGSVAMDDLPAIPTTEQIQDIVGAMVVDSSSIDATYDDGAGTVSLAVVLEWLQDAVAAMLTGGSHTNLTATYQDAGGVIDLAASGGGSYTDEEARDAIGVALVAGNNIDITVNDGADTITIDVEALTSADLSDFTEAAQDAIGAMIADTASINLTYTDATPELKADAIFGTSAGTVAEGNHTHAGSGITVQEEDSTVATGVTTLDFDGSDFNTADEGSGEVRVGLNYGTGAGQPAEGNHSHSAPTQTVAVQEEDVTVDAAAQTLDFDGSDFNLTSEAGNEVRIGLNYGTGAGQPAEGNHSHGGGATITVQEGDSDVDTAVTTLDFDASDFNVSSSPAGEANISLAYGVGAGTPAEGNHTHSSGDGTVAPTLFAWREKQHLPIGGSTTFVNVGFGSSPSTTGTPANADDVDGGNIQYTTGAVSGNTGGILSSAGGNPFRARDWTPRVIQRIKTGSSIANVRYWVGMAASTPSGSDTPAVHYAAFRFSTGVPDTNWQAVTDSGSGTPTVTDTGVAVAASTLYDLRVEADASEIRFYLNNTLVATHTTTLPGASTLVAVVAQITTLTGAGKVFQWYRAAVVHK